MASYTPYEPYIPEELKQTPNAFGLWKLDVDADGTVVKRLVPLTGQRPDPSNPETMVSYARAEENRRWMLESYLNGKGTQFPQAVYEYVEHNPRATPCGLIWLIQSGYFVLDYDLDTASASRYDHYYDKYQTYVERSSRGIGAHQIFSVNAHVTGVLNDLFDDVDARGAENFLYMTGRCPPGQTTIQPLPAELIELVKTREDTKLATRRSNEQFLADAFSRGQDEVTNEQLRANFFSASDPHTVSLANDPQTLLDSDNMYFIVKRLMSCSADYYQILALFLELPCARVENITRNKLRNKMVRQDQLAGLFQYHFDIIKPKFFAQFQVQLNLQFEKPAPVGPIDREVLDIVETQQSKIKCKVPDIPQHLHFIRDALNFYSPVPDEIGFVSVIQFTRFLLGNRLTAEHIYSIPGSGDMRAANSYTKCLPHFMLLALPNTGKTRSIERIEVARKALVEWCGVNKPGTLLPLAAVHAMPQGQMGAQKLARSMEDADSTQAIILHTDEAETNFSNGADPGAAMPFLKLALLGFNIPGYKLTAGSTSKGEAISFEDPTFQFTITSTADAMRPLLSDHVGGGLMSRFLLVDSDIPPPPVVKKSGRIIREHKTVEAEAQQSAAFNKMLDLYSSPAATILYPDDGLPAELLDRLCSLELAGDRVDSDTALSTVRHPEYAQFLSAIYVRALDQGAKYHTEESLEWGISVLEYVGATTRNFFHGVNNSVDQASFQVKQAKANNIYADKYLRAILSFFVEDADREALKHCMFVVRRLSDKNKALIDSGVLTCGMINQYTHKFFDLSRTEVASAIKGAALKELHASGSIEILDATTKLPLSVLPSDIPANAELRPA